MEGVEVGDVCVRMMDSEKRYFGKWSNKEELWFG